MINKKSEKREEFFVLIAASILVICRTVVPSLCGSVQKIFYRPIHLSRCITRSWVFHVCICKPYDQYPHLGDIRSIPVFRERSSLLRVYKSVCSRPPWNRARNISSAQRFYGSCGTPKGTKERRVEQGYNKATAAAPVALPFSCLPPFLAFFPVCLCSALFDPKR